MRRRLLGVGISTTGYFHQLLSQIIITGEVSSITLKTLNSTIQSSSPEASVLLYNLIRRQSISPDTYTIPLVLGRVGRLRWFLTLKSIHGEIFKHGFESNVYVQNSLIHAYFLCGSPSEGRKVFDYLKITATMAMDAVTWNTVMSGYLNTDDHQSEKSLAILSDMIKERRFLLDRVCLVNSLIGCGRTGRIRLGKQIHGRIITSGFFGGRDFYVGSSSIQMYVLCGYLSDARNVFDALCDRKNLVCWTSMIAGYTNSDMFLDALDLFGEMRTEKNQRIKADAVTVACVISACAHLGALAHGKWVHAYCSTNGLAENLKVKTALIDMYSKCGDIDKALDIFNSTLPHHRDVYLWTSTICGLAMHGRAEESVRLFSSMKVCGSRCQPNEVTFLGVLTACVHGGLVTQGLQFFNSMLTTYNLNPRIQHYGCIVDLLCRAKLLERTEELISRMPVEPDIVIWRSVMFGWAGVGNFGKAETIGRKLTELEPETIEAHVLLSNVYAFSSKWRDVNRVRRRMKNRGLRKVPGCSLVEIDGVVHEFLAGDCDILI